MVQCISHSISNHFLIKHTCSLFKKLFRSNLKVLTTVIFGHNFRPSISNYFFCHRNTDFWEKNRLCDKQVFVNQSKQSLSKIHFKLMGIFIRSLQNRIHRFWFLYMLQYNVVQNVKWAYDILVRGHLKPKWAYLTTTR